MKRDEAIKGLRPLLELSTEVAKPFEAFQNTTLRPILKLQQDLTFSIFKKHKNYRLKEKSSISKEEYVSVVSKFVQSNLDLKNQLVGMIVGLFTTVELEYYLSQRKELNRRIIKMQVKRFVDTIFSS